MWTTAGRVQDNIQRNENQNVLSYFFLRYLSSLGCIAFYIYSIFFSFATVPHNPNLIKLLPDVYNLINCPEQVHLTFRVSGLLVSCFAIYCSLRRRRDVDKQ